MLSLYLIIRSKYKLDVIFRCLDIPTVRSRIAFITTGPSWSNVSIQGNFLLTGFFLDAARLESWMTRLSDSSPSSVSSPYYISYKQIARSIPMVLFLVICFPLGLAVEAFAGFILTVFSVLSFNTSWFSNQTSGSNITMPNLIRSW